MKLRKIISVLLVAVLTLSLAVSCGDENQLSAPDGLTVSTEGLVSWNAVENATGYVVKVNDSEYNVTETQYQLTDTSASATISVYATAKGYKNSEPTSTTFTVTAPSKLHTVAIKAPDSVRGYKDNTTTLKAYIDGEQTGEVEWKVTSGSDYVSIDSEGKVTVLQDVTGDKLIKVTATAKDDVLSYAETEFIVAAKPALTQSMLDAVAQSTVAFEGFVRLDVYENKLGAKGKFNSTYMSTVRTAMDGNNWYAEYTDASLGVNQRIFCRNVNGIATQIGVNLMNEEQSYAMQDDDGNTISWVDSGFYNSLIGLTVDDFTFNETDWRYEYVPKGSDDKTIARVNASANPYTLEPLNLQLIIDDGEIMGIYSLAKDDLNIAAGYITEPRLYVAIDVGENVSVPTIGKYKNYNDYAVDSDEYNVLKRLHDAVENARNATCYNLTITHVQNSSISSTMSITEGYEETITADKCHFREYDILNQGTTSERNVYRDSQYGYRKISDNLYNSYYSTTTTDETTGESTLSFAPTRAFAASFNDAKPSLAFSEAIFTSYAVDETSGSITYYVDENMYSVATTFYKGIGNDIALYGIFATKGYVNNSPFTPFVTVSSEGVLEGAGFYYNVGYMYGVMVIEYTDYNDSEKVSIDTATETAINAMTTRQLPSSWEELNITVTVTDSNTGKDTDVYYKFTEYVPAYFTKVGTPMSTNAEIPFFGAEECLGDTYGFGMVAKYRLDLTSSAKDAILLYYDVPLDIDYTIQTSLDKVDAFLKSKGYTANASGEYRSVSNNLVIVPKDSDLDLTFYIYVDKE